MEDGDAIHCCSLANCMEARQSGASCVMAFLIRTSQTSLIFRALYFECNTNFLMDRRDATTRNARLDSPL